jgi:hypothetical protein
MKMIPLLLKEGSRVVGSALTLNPPPPPLLPLRRGVIFRA